MTLGATYYVIGVTLISTAFPTLLVALWTRYSAHPRPVAVRARRHHTHCAGAPNSA